MVIKAKKEKPGQKKKPEAKKKVKLVKTTRETIPRKPAKKIQAPKKPVLVKKANGSTPLTISPERSRRTKKITPLKEKPLLKKKRAPKKIAVSTALPSVAEVTQVEIAPEIEVTPPPPAPKIIKEEIKPEPIAPRVELKELELKLPITLKDLAIKIQQKPSVLIKMLMEMKVMVGINQILEDRLVENICEKFGFRLKKAPDEEESILLAHQKSDEPKLLEARAPVVTLMGHVDHGKTSLLDAIRKTKVAESEHGGITQHIGAYRVSLPNGEITFLDTPGHEAFTAMRARGARITDIVILVVAADEGIMPQTQEAIDHARAAGVSILVAINKIDKPQANIDRVKKQLAELDLMAEDWGGKTITVPVSAKTGEGISALLEMVLLEAQMLELKTNPHRLASGVVIEAKLTKGRGPVVTLLVQNGTLHLNETIIVGNYYGKIKAMFDEHGQATTKATPSFPVVVLGISEVPEAGERFFVVENEKLAKELAEKRQEEARQRQIKTVKRINLEDLHAQIQEGKIKELKLILKVDVQGSLEAIKETLGKLDVSEIKLEIIHQGTGSINSSDVILAMASDALILGFNVTADERAKELAAKEGVDIRSYNIIYELGNDIKTAIEGMLEPKLKKVVLGRVEIRKVFKLSRAGMVAGCFVSKGKITRTALVNLIRNGEVIFQGNISSLKRFKDDVREVTEGYECGITISGFADCKEGDIIEAYEMEKIAKKL